MFVVNHTCLYVIVVRIYIYIHIYINTNTFFVTVQYGGSNGSMFSYTGYERLNGILKWGILNTLDALWIKNWTVDYIPSLKLNDYSRSRVGRFSEYNIETDITFCNNFSLFDNEYINGYRVYKGLRFGSFLVCGLELI